MTAEPGELLTAWDSEIPFAQRAWHTCWSCRHDDGSSSNGTPPWHICSIRVALRFETDEGRTCNRYSPLPWAVAP